MMKKHYFRSLAFMFVLLLPTNIGYCSIALIESPPFMELAEQADLILIAKVKAIEVDEVNTVTIFQVSEYIKDWKSSPEFTLKLRGGTNLIVMPAKPTFNIGDEHLLFLMEKNEINLMNDEKSYYLLFDRYGKPLLENVDIDSLNTVRELYSSTIVGDDSMWVYKLLAGSLISVLLLYILNIRRQRFS